LNCGKDRGRLRCFVLYGVAFFGKLLPRHSEELGDDAGAVVFDFDFGRERAMDGIDDDLFDKLGFDGSAAVGQDLWEIEAGDLKAVEEQAGAAWVDVIGGNTAEDLADGLLDGAAVFGMREVEVGAAAAALAWVFDGATRGVVVITKFFVTETGAATAASVGEDVAALKAFFGLDFVVVHGGTPLPIKIAQSIQKKRPASVLGCRSLA
jgi:hypothetical protein